MHIKRPGRLIAGVTLLLVVAGAGYVAFVFDANAYKPRVIAAVQQYTGRALAIDGDLTVALLPSPHATLHQIRLAEAAGFGTQAFAEIGAVSIYPSLLPLLRRRLELKAIVLEHPDLHLLKNKAGDSNWADLLQKRAPEVQGPGAPAATVVIRSLRIQEGELRFDDEAANRYVVVSNLDLSASGLGYASPATIEVRADVSGGQRKFEIVLEANGKGVYASSHESLSGTFNVALKDAAGQVAASAQVTASPEGGAPPRIDARLTVPEFSPRRLLGHLGKTVPAMRDNSALTRARFAIDVTGDQARLVLRPTGQLDDSNLDGEITVQGGFEHPVIRFDLAVDQIDLDRYRPPQPKGPPSPDGQDAISKISNEELRALGLNIRGNVRVGKITLNGDRTSNFVAKLEWNP